MSPGIGVVVPVFNAASLLPAAIRSIRAELGPGDEIVVVDDGSTDDVATVAATLADAPGTPLRLLRTPNRGPAAARNAGIAALRAPILAFLDADDMWTAGRTAVLRRRMAIPDRADVVFGKTHAIPVDPDDPLWKSLLRVRDVSLAPLVGAGLYRRESFERIGGFDETLRFGEDIDWFLRALEAKLRVVFLDLVALTYHLHSGNMTRDRVATNRSVASVLSRSVRRRRATGDLRPLPQPSDLLEPVP